MWHKKTRTFGSSPCLHLLTWVVENIWAVISLHTHLHMPSSNFPLHVVIKPYVPIVSFHRLQKLFRDKSCALFEGTLPYNISGPTLTNRSRDSSVTIVTGLWAGRRGNWSFISDRGEISFLHSVQTGSGAHPASSPMDTVRQGGRGEKLITPLSTAEVKMWSYTSTPSPVLN
jgi:hypothetical protein